MTSIRRAAAATLLALGMVTVGAPAAHAAPPVPLIERSGFGDNGTDGSGFYAKVYFAGDTQAYATVRVYSNSTCTGTPLQVTQADNYGHWGVQTTLRPGQSITGYATGTDGTGTSACSPGAGPYSVPLPPNTKFKKTPKKVIRYDADRKIDGIYVTFKYKSSTGTKLFTCTLDKRPINCGKNGKFKVSVKLGKHKFVIAALDERFPGLADPTPATFKFKLKNKK